MIKPLRPALPALLLPLALCWLGILAATELNYQHIAVTPWITGLLAALVFLGVAIKAQKTRRFSLPLLTLSALVLGFAAANTFYANINQQIQKTESLGDRHELVVIEDTRAYTGSFSSEAFLYVSDAERLRVRIFWHDSDLALSKGSHITATVSFKPLKDDQRWLYEKGLVGSVSLSDVENKGFSRDAWGVIDTFRYKNVSMIEALEGEGAPLLAGVLLGYRSLLHDSATEQDFITCGLTHLIAVSGSHLAVVAALLAWFLRKLPLSRSLEVILLVLVLLAYVLLTGVQPSAIRSAIMAGVAGFSLFVGRRGHAPSALAFAACAMLVAYPANAYSLGFWLSVSAVFGITLFTHLVTHWAQTAVSGRSDKAPGAVVSAFALTLTATASTLPLAVPSFAVLSLIGPVANLIAGPLISVVLVLGILALFVILLIPPLGMLLLTLASGVAGAVAHLASFLAGIPWASIPLELPLLATAVVALVVGGLIYALWPAPQAKTLRVALPLTLVLVMSIALVSIQTSAPRLVVMDVGQGDALLVQEKGTTVLIDTGESKTALVKALARNGVTRIDAVIITHLDSDHAGALGRLRGLVPVEKVYFAHGLLDAQKDDPYIGEAHSLVGADKVSELCKGDVLELSPSLALTVLWPEQPAEEGSNAESVCTLLSYDANDDKVYEYQALLTGDAESPEISRILENNPDLYAEILKLGHHGSQDAITVEQLERLQNRVVCISVGAQNRYGHPHKEILDIIETYGARVYRTDTDGDILCRFEGANLQLRCANMEASVH